MLAHRQSLVALTIGILLLLFGSAVPAAQVNINTADAATLARELKGIGLKRAQDIVDYRQKHGPFRSADELALVKGIGPAAIAKNRELIRTDARGAPAAARAPASPAAKSVSTPTGSSTRSR
jgi:competence protein ComEA